MVLRLNKPGETGLNREVSTIVVEVLHGNLGRVPRIAMHKDTDRWSFYIVAKLIVNDFSTLRTLVSGVTCICSFQNADPDSIAICSEDLC